MQHKDMTKTCRDIISANNMAKHQHPQKNIRRFGTRENRTILDLSPPGNHAMGTAVAVFRCSMGTSTNLHGS